GQPAAQPAYQPSDDDRGPHRTVTDLNPTGGQFVALATANGKVVLPIADVKSVAGADVATEVMLRERVVEKTKRLSFEAKPGAVVSLHLYYFTPGVRWIPTYRLEGFETGKPRLDLQAEILNDLGDLGRTPIDLVGGVPNFRFKSIPS